MQVRIIINYTKNYVKTWMLVSTWAIPFAEIYSQMKKQAQSYVETWKSAAT